MTDAEFHRAFVNLDLPAAEFRHTEHIRAAWGCFRSTGEFAAGAAEFTRHFRAFVTKLGAGAKYHETITWYFLVQVHERMALTHAAQTWDEFRAANPDLFEGGMRILRTRYQPATLDGAHARRVFVLPDARPASG